MNKVVRVGMAKQGSNLGSIFVKINFADGRLSMTGVIGPLRNGNALGGCGQIDMEFAHRNPAHNDSRYIKPIQPSDIDFAPNWNAEKWLDLLDVWRKWHMNDCTAGSPAQEQELEKHAGEFPGYPKSHFEWAVETLTKVGPFTVWCYDDLTPEQDAQYWAAALTNKRFKRAPKILATSTKFETRAEADKYAKTIAAERVAEVRGLECDNGYRYGSAWLKRDIPADVLEFLQSLPDTDVTPAWI